MVAIDIETTGLSPKDSGICQLSMVRFDEKTFKVLAKWDHYIKPRPDAVWSPGAISVSGITPETVENEKSIDFYADEILTFIGNDSILTYNGNTFDIPFIQEELGRVGKQFIIGTRRVYDSYYIESLLHPRKLTKVFEKYMGKTMDEAGLTAHNSLSDVMATIAVFKKQAEIIDIDTTTTTNTCGGVVGYNDNKEPILLIGKYKNATLQSIIKNDPNYVAWLVKEKRNTELFTLVKEEYNKVRK